MASAATILGRETRVRGRVTGTGDVEVHGHLEGELTASGEVRVESTATIAADVRARRIVVRGAIRGDLNADEAIVLEEGARVVGDVRAPRVAIAPGGLVRGYVETGHAGEGKSAARSTATRAAPAPVRHVAVPTPVKSAPKVAAKAAPAHHAKPAVKGRLTLAGGKAADSSPRAGAPKPVVPVLKKGTKAALTKRR
jgi:cytoskeletal protein CcmA (bactofilin family)